MPNGIDDVIIVGKLDDKELRASITSLVEQIKDSTKQMSDAFDSSMSKVSEALSKITTATQKANSSIVEQKEKTEKQSAANSELASTYSQLADAVEKVVQRNSGLRSTFNADELQSYRNLLREVRAELLRTQRNYGEIFGEPYKVMEQQLRAIIVQYEQAYNNLQSVMQKQGTLNMKDWSQQFGAAPSDELKRMGELYREEAKASDESAKAAKKAADEKIKAAEKARAEELKYQDAVLKENFRVTLKMPTENVDQMQQKLDALQQKLATFRDLGILPTSTIERAEKEITNLQNAIQTASQKAAQGVTQESNSYDGLIGQLKAAEEQARKRYDVSPILEYRMRLHELAVEYENEAAKQKESTQQINAEYAALRGQIETVGRRRTELESKQKLSSKEAAELRYLTQEWERLNEAIKANVGTMATNQKMEAIKQEYAEIQTKIRVLGEEMLRGTSLAKEYSEKIASITDKKSAKSATQDVLSFPTENLDQAAHKIGLIKQLADKLRGTKLLDDSEKRALQSAFSEAQQHLARYEEEKRRATLIEKGYSEEILHQADLLRQSAQFQRYGVATIDVDGKTITIQKSEEKTLEESIRDAIQKANDERRQSTSLSKEQTMATRASVEAEMALTDEERRRQAVEKSITDARTAQVTAMAGVADIYAQHERADYTEQINGVKELRTALTTMQRALSGIGDSEAHNALRSELERDIDKTKKAIDFATRYNLVVSGIGSVGDAPKDTLNVKIAEAQKLASVFRNLSEAERDATPGQNLIKSLQATNREIAEIEALLKRPVSLDNALALPERNLSDIAYKMQQLQAFREGVNVLDPNNITIIEKINQELDRLKNTQAEIGNKGKSKDFTSIMGMSEGTLDNISEKIRSLQSHKGQLRLTDPSDVEKLHQINEEISRLEKIRKSFSSKGGGAFDLKSVLGMSENTIDAITAKMRELKSLQGTLDINKQTAEIKNVNQELDRLKKRLQEVQGEQMKAYQTTSALTKAFNYARNRLAFYFTVGASTQFVKQLIEIRGQYEMTERALGVLMDSAQRGTQIFNELSQMALVSPYTLIELSDAARQLTAYQVAAKDVVDTTRRLADMSAAVGIPIERLTYALGQIKAYGYLNSRDARMFLNAGIPLVQNLADHYSELQGKIVSVADVYDMIKKKAVSYNDVMQVITKMTSEGGQFFDFQAKMAETLKVQLANLTLAWNNMLNDIGSSQQSLLELPIKGLKELFLHWKDINVILNDLIITFGLAKAAQILLNVAFGKGTLAAIGEASSIAGSTAETYRNILSKKNLTKAHAMWLAILNRGNVQLKAALVNMGLLTTTELRQIMSLNKLQAAYKLFFLTLKIGWKGAIALMKTASAAMLSMLTNPVFLAITAISAVVDLVQHFRSVSEKNAEITKSIQENAKEAADSIEKVLKLQEIVDAKNSASSGKLQEEEAQKAWEALREELEKSALSHDIIISKLQKEADLNKRVVGGYEALESVKRVKEAFEKMKGDLKIDQDSWLWGAFGEGLAEDVQDVAEDIKGAKKAADEFEQSSSAIGQLWASMKYAWNKAFEPSEMNEARKEVEDFAKDASALIKNNLSKEDLEDPKAVQEAIEMVRATIKQNNPELAGEAGQIFDILLDQSLPKFLGEQADKTKSAVAILLDEVKRKSAGEFQNLTDDIYDKTGSLTDKQKEIIRQEIDKLPPYVKNVLGDVENLINSYDFRIKIGVTFGVQDLDAIQKDFNSHFNTMIQTGYQQYNKNTGETYDAWEKRLNENWNANLKTIATTKNMLKQVKDTESDRYKTLSNTLKTLEGEQAVLEDIAKYEGFNLKEKGKKDKKGTKPEDQVANALKEELSIINQMRTNYDKLRKAGVDATTALTMASSGYEKSLEKINLILGKYGIAKFDAKNFVGKDASDPNTLLGALKKQLETLQQSGKVKTASLKSLEVEIQKIEVDAKTYNMKKITDGLNNELSKIKEEYELAIELDANPELGNMFEQMFDVNTSTLPKSFAEAYDKANEVAKQKLAEISKENGKTIEVSTFDLMSTDIRKFAELSNIETDSDVFKGLIAQQKTWRDTFKKNLTDTEKYLDDYIKKYGNYADKVAEIEANRLEQLKKLNEAYFTDEMRDTAEYRAKYDAINKGADKQIGQAKFDDFKNSQMYITLFENLDYVSTATIKSLKAKLEELKDSMGELTPEQMKQVVQQYEKLDSELIKRNPFKALTTNYKGFIKALKNRKQADNDLIVAQEKYNDALEELIRLKKLLEQAKREGDKDGVDSLEQQIQAQEGVVKKTKEANDNAAQTSTAYKDSIKSFGKGLEGVAKNFTDAVNAAVSIRDTLEGVGVHFSDNINGALDALSESSEAFGEFVTSALTGNIFGMVAAGFKGLVAQGKMWVSLFGKGKKDYFTPLKESLEVLLNTIEKVASYQLEALGKMSGSRAVKQYDELIKNNEKVIDSYRDLADAAGRSGKSIGAHSYAYRTNKRLAGHWEEISKYAGVTVTKIEDLYKLTPEQLKAIMTGNAALWSQIEENIRESLEAIIGQGEKAKEYAEALGEALTNVSLDGVVNDFESMLQDMESDTKTFAEKFEEYMRNAIIRSMMIDGYATELETWYEHFKNRMADDGLSVSDVNALRDEYMDIVRRALAERDQLLSVVGAPTSKELSALQQGIQGITEDTAGAIEAYLNGISQQVYLHSDLLTQIRNVVVGWNMDAELSVQSQMLLQLQNSYQVQMSIQNILTNVLTPSGNAFNVQLQ